MLIAHALSLALAIPTTEVDTLFKTVDRPDSPGCALEVRRDGQRVLRRSYGRADLEFDQANTPDTVFEAGSVSKQFTGALIARLAQRGALAFDDSVRRWLPELPPQYQRVSVDMLLHHTSGIRDWSDLAELTGWPRGSRTYSMDDAIGMIARQTAFNFEPGSQYLYSNSNYLLAARIAERAGGRPLAELAQAELFGPLGLSHTRWRTDFRDLVPGRAQAYSPDEAGRWQLDMPFEDVVGPGGLLTTVSDLQHWIAALSDPRLGWTARMVEPGRLRNGTRVPYGLGLELETVNGHVAISHAGATAGYRAWLGSFPQAKVSVALLCNAGSLNTEDLGPALAAVFLPAAVSPPRSLSGRHVPDGIVGSYRNAATDAVVRISESQGLLRIGQARFALEGTDHFVGVEGRSATVTRDDQGRVTAIEVSRIANASLTLRPAQEWTPDTPSLRALVGIYRSEDVEGTQGLTLVANTLAWVDPRGTAHALHPTVTDTFTAPDIGWILRVRRDAAGLAIGFAASTVRARQILFDREAPSRQSWPHSFEHEPGAR